jgi:flavin reductase (DIM6/NTAB) family NADH-FMN oxidoreductase RutF
MCGHDGAEPVGMAVNSFSSVSLEPALVSVCVAKNSSTWPRLDSLPRVGLSILAADQEVLSRQLSSRHGDRFADVALERGEESALFISRATLWLDCRIADRLPGGDHHIILFEVLNSKVFPDVEPLVFHQSQYLGLSHAS